MSQPLLTEPPEKTNQRIERRGPPPESARQFKNASDPIFQLQRALGNQGVAQLIRAKRLTPDGKVTGLQPKLTVGAANDQYEQEADRIARQVVSMPDPASIPSTQPPQVEEQASHAQSIQSKLRPLAASITPFVQRRAAIEEERGEDKGKKEDKEQLSQTKFLDKSTALPLQRQSSEKDEPESIQAKFLAGRDSLHKEGEENSLQAKRLSVSNASSLQRQIEKKENDEEEPQEQETAVQAKPSFGTNTPSIRRQPLAENEAEGETEKEDTASISPKSDASPISSFDPGADVESRLSSSKGQGSPLPDHLRSYMEPRFGVDFGDVRIHTGSSAAQMNRSVGAKAFTHGPDIYYSAESNPSNLELTAHELTHVVQQTGGAPLRTKRVDDLFLDYTNPSIQPTCSACVVRGSPCPKCASQDREEKKLIQAKPQVRQAVHTYTRMGDWASDPVPRPTSGSSLQPKLEVNANRQIEPPLVQQGGEEKSQATGPKRAVSATAAGIPGTENRGATAESENDSAAANVRGRDAATPNSSLGASRESNSSPTSSPATANRGTPTSSTPLPAPTTSDPRHDGTPNNEAPSATNGNESGRMPASSGLSATTTTGGPLGNGASSGPTPGAPSASSGGGTVTSSAQGACAGGRGAHCYNAPSDQPAEEPAEVPPNPAPTRVQEQTSDVGEEDLPEPDDCPAEQPHAALPSTPTGGALEMPGVPGSPPAPLVASSPTAPSRSVPVAAPQGAGAVGPAPGGSGSLAIAAGEAVAALSSPLDPVIATAEARRDGAATAYRRSSGELTTALNGTRKLRNGTQFIERPDESIADTTNRRSAVSRVDSFFTTIADQLDNAIAMASGQIPDQLGVAANSAKAQIAASIETQKLAISTRTDQARKQARNDAAVARKAITQQAAAFVADAEAQTSAAIKSLTATRSKTMEQVNELETSTLDNINQIYSGGRIDLEGLGATVGNECTAKGEEFANIYRGFRHCTQNGFWDGDLSERRSIAQEDAAHSVAKGYHDRIVESARKRAREITKAGRKSDRCSVITSAIHTRNTLDEQLSHLKSALETARDAATQQAESMRDGLIASIDSSLIATLHQLDHQEHEQRQTADDTGYLQQVLQEQIAHAAAAAIQQGVYTAAVSAQSALSAVQAQCAVSTPPDPSLLDRALLQAQQNVTAALDGLQGSAEGGTAMATNQLTIAAQQGLAALGGVAQSNDELAGSLSAGFTTSMAAIGGTDNFASQRNGFAQQIHQSTSAGETALSQALEGMRRGCNATTQAARTALTQAHADLEQNLRQSKQGLECEIPRQADEAASHEAPAWKMLVAVLLVIVVIVIVIAVTIATAGGALAALGPLATIAVGAAIGAAVGAVTSGLLAVASNLWSNRSWSQGLGQAVLVGAITGAIGGGIGAGVGLALKGATTAVQLGAAMVTAGGLDVVTQYVMGGFSFEHFKWTNLGVTLLITFLTFGLAHRVAARVPTRGAPGTEGTPRTTVPAEGAPVGAPAEPSGPRTTAPTETEVPVAAPAESGTPRTAGPPEGEVPAAVPTEPTRPPTPVPAETEVPVSAPAEPAASKTTASNEAEAPVSVPAEPPAPAEPASSPRAEEGSSMPRRPTASGEPPTRPQGRKPSINEPNAAEWRYQEYAYNKALKGETPKPPNQWYDEHFLPSFRGDRPGRLGGPQQVSAKEQLLTSEGIQPVENVELGGRYPDGIDPNPNAAGGRDYYEVGKMNRSGLPEARERLKLADEVNALGPNDSVTFVDKANIGRRVIYRPGDNVQTKTASTKE